MRLYVNFYQFSRWLDEYVGLFLGLVRENRPFALEQFLTPRANDRQRGGGFDAPPLVDALGLGGCQWNMRESYRHLQGRLEGRERTKIAAQKSIPVSHLERAEFAYPCILMRAELQNESVANALCYWFCDEFC